MTTALLSTTYFGPIQWYQKLHRYDAVWIEACESFIKQTFRNRCLIATTQGVQALTVPVKAPSEGAYISDHGNWRHLHWQALQSAYGDSPFFEYYADDLRPFFTEHRWELLLDFNEAIRQKMCELLDIQPHVAFTTEFLPPDAKLSVSGQREDAATELHDFRYAIQPKHPLPDVDFEPRPYYQVFAGKHGFLPNLSILDLLFNMGPESIYYL